MKLKTRLIISFLTIIFVPVLLSGLVIYGFGTYQLRSIDKNYGLEGTTYETVSNSTKVLSRLTKNIFEQIKRRVSEEPDIMNNIQYINSVNEELCSKSSFFVVRKGDTILYSGTSKVLSEELISMLPSYGDASHDSEGGTYLAGDFQVLVKQIDFIFEDGEEGSAFILTSMAGVLPQVKHFFYDLGIALIAILILTGALLTMWIYRGVARPLKKLKTATQNIKEGNLDFTLEAEGKDEIAELCVDFEEMRQRLKESSEEKVNFDRQSKELISNISHDLKTPITAIKGYVEGIMDGVADTPEKMDRYIKTIYNKANEMDGLINELTLYSKIDTNRIPYTFNKINVNNYFADCVEELGLDLEARGVDLGYFNYVDNSTQIIADAEQLTRVIHNIVNNSIKYMDKSKGIINIRVKDVGDFIQVEVEDNGKGMAQKDIPHIFERFYRTDASRNSAQGGSGIGLSIVKKIIEDHGGKIWATSKEGIGTAMYFVIRKYQEVKAE